MVNLKTLDYTSNGQVFCDIADSTDTTVFNTTFIGQVYCLLLPITNAILKYWNGSSWVNKPLKYYNGSSFVVKPARFWTGSFWRNIS